MAEGFYLNKETLGLKAIWLATEPHMRSVQLAAALHCPMYALLKSDSDIAFRPLRYIYYVYKTLWILLRHRPQVVFVQNPSIFLAFVVCFLSFFFRYRVIVDRHSNFKLDKATAPQLKWRLFQRLSRYTMKRASLTVVTNDFFKDYVDARDGQGIVLQDKFPQLELAETKELKGTVNIVVVSTFSDDEPLGAVFATAKELPPDWMVYVTGKYEGKTKFTELISLCPANIILTGYVSDREYQSLLKSVDVVVVLTTEENLLTCGAYEAISLGKALVISDTEALREYFRFGVIYSKNTPGSLRKNIVEAVRRKEQLELEVVQLRGELVVEWQYRFERLVDLVQTGR